MDSSRLVVGNPYLGQRRWIEPRHSFQRGDSFSLGYDNNNLNHKILRIFDEIHPVTDRNVLGLELYDFSSSSWKVLDATQGWQIRSHQHSVSLKGNAYFTTSVAGFFDAFSFHNRELWTASASAVSFFEGLHFTYFSCVRQDDRQDELSVLYQSWESPKTIEISVTDKIGPDVVSWTKFLKVDFGYWFETCSRRFLVDEEKKIAVVFLLERAKACWYQTAHVFGQDGYFKSVLDATQGWQIRSHQHSVSLKGNAYFTTSVAGFFVCFHFTTESFGPLLPLPPFHSYEGLHFTYFSCVRQDDRQDELSVLYQSWESPKTIEISVTDKIGPDVVSWTKFLKVDFGYWFETCSRRFLVDEEKKIAVVFLLERAKACWYQTAHVFGQDGYFKSVRIREAPDLGKPCYPHERYCAPLFCSSYLPSLVQLNQPG
ncbi:hypothetical protein Bca52824_045078 [Brassica carinata]|uniref:F-box associated beta-propeller type 1 domain-containing protein n=1 Tax=Brassica carinata TaxID=52824 RepID=A0A8X7RHJ7_BRACI|nr:hypothetical protein Bca52824_045078 [Brassica carinata]